MIGTAGRFKTFLKADEKTNISLFVAWTVAYLVIQEQSQIMSLGRVTMKTMTRVSRNLLNARRNFAKILATDGVDEVTSFFHISLLKLNYFISVASPSLRSVVIKLIC